MLREENIVSVVVPAYNCADCIGQAIDSILDQKYPFIEIIFVDDGSTDDTQKVLESYQNRITVLSQPNSGAAAARNTGLKSANGAYVSFLDSDDIWLPGKVDAQVKYLELHPDVGMVYHSWEVWRTDSEGKFLLPELDNIDSVNHLDTDNSGWIYNKLLMDFKKQ